MAVKVLIGADDREYAATSDYNIRQQAGAVSSTSIEVELGVNSIPLTLESCQILFDDVPVFWGIIQAVDSPQWETGKEVKRYSLSVSSGEIVFQNRLVSESLVSVFTHEIVDRIFDNYIIEEGITLGQISTTTREFETYVANFQKAYDILSELADEIGAVCFISPNKKFYFLNQTDFAQVQYPAQITNLRKSEKAQDLRSVQIVTGATENTTQQTRQVVWEANQLEQILSYPLSVAPLASINAASVGVGLGGIDESDITKTFLWTLGSNTVRVNGNATTKPTTGDTVVFLFEGYYDILVTLVNDQLVSDLAAISGTSGKIERIFTDETINNYTDAETLSNNLLDQFGQRESEISLRCHDLEASEINNMWTFNDEPYISLGITGQYVIVERTISRLYDGKYTIDCKLRNRNFFSRYGTVFNNLDKTNNPNIVIYKSSSFGDTMESIESYTFNTNGIPIFPSATQLYDPLGFPFYPFDFGTAVSVLPYEIGDVLDDGSIVFYVTDEGMHGLIAAPSTWRGAGDQPFFWSNVAGLIGTTSEDVGTGYANTLAIIGQTSFTSGAAKYCYDYTNQAGKWQLPSLDEVDLMYAEKVLLEMQNEYYWSSSEIDAGNATAVSITDGSHVSQSKSAYCLARPIRSF